MDVRDNLKYTKQHEWVLIEDDQVTLGITDFAQNELGDIVFVEMPETGTLLNGEDIIGNIESVKAVSEIFCPLSGEIIEINKKLEEEPELVNTQPYEDGWIVKLKISPEELAEANLLSPEEYRALTE